MLCVRVWIQYQGQDMLHVLQKRVDASRKVIVSYILVSNFCVGSSWVAIENIHPGVLSKFSCGFGATWKRKWEMIENWRDALGVSYQTISMRGGSGFSFYTPMHCTWARLAQIGFLSQKWETSLLELATRLCYFQVRNASPLHRDGRCFVTRVNRR